MTNGTTLPKKNDNFNLKMKKIIKASILIGQNIDNLSYKLSGRKPNKCLDVTKNPINANGKRFESKINRNIQLLDGFKSSPQHRMSFTDSESVIAFGKKSIVIDEFITSEHCGKTLYAEVKYQNVNGTVAEKNFKNVYLFTHLKKQELFIVSGDFYNKNYIDGMNNSFLETGTLNYIYIVHEFELEKFLNLWKEQPVTDFVALHFLMSAA